jgi:molybdopterin synthase catalytic subunit
VSVTPSPTVVVGVFEAPLSVEEALAHCDAADHGAAILFVGRVRNINDGRSVRAVSYDVHEALCRREFTAMCDEAQERWGADLRMWLVHRQGRLEIGEASVVVAVSSRHRDHAFTASRYLVEQMKLRAPIWKQEHYVDGDSEWLRGHALVPSV